MPDRRALTSPQNGRLGGKPKGRGRGPLIHTRARAAAIQTHAELDAQTVIEQMARGALYDPGAFLDANGNFKPLSELTEAQRQCIAGIEFVMKNATAGDGQIDRVLKLKLVSREKFVEMAARYHSLLVDRVDATLQVQGVGQKLDQARLRAAQASKLRRP